jgi:signal transduction histidine kinase
MRAATRIRYTPVLWSMIILSVLIGVLASAYVYFLITDALSRNIVDRARIAAATIDPALVGSLTGTDADIQSQAYITLKHQLTRLREANSDTRFVYLMALKGTDVVFLVDSEPSDSEDYSPPGQVYYEASETLFDALRFGISGYELERDRWGRWLSGLTPIIQSGDSGGVVAVLGIDVAVGSEYIPTVLLYSLLPLITALAVAVVLGASYITTRNEEYRLQAEGESLSVASHEIRTPLTGIVWATEAMLAENISPGLRAKLLAMHASAQQVIESVTNLLTMHVLNNHHALALDSIPVAELLDEVVHTYTLSAQARGITFVCTPVTPANVAWKGERDKIRLMLSNLVSNAVKYADKQTTIELVFSSTATSGTISITNTGSGIVPADMPHIFEGFHRGVNADKQAEGSGLGLSLVNRIAQLHGGSISVRSTPGASTTFSVTIPLTSSHA